MYVWFGAVRSGPVSRVLVFGMLGIQLCRRVRMYAFLPGLLAVSVAIGTVLAYRRLT